jgi:hypothetical protein
MNTEKLLNRIKAVVKKYGPHNPQLNTLRDLYELYRTRRDPIAQALLMHEVVNLERGVPAS